MTDALAALPRKALLLLAENMRLAKAYATPAMLEEWAGHIETLLAADLEAARATPQEKKQEAHPKQVAAFRGRQVLSMEISDDDIQRELVLSEQRRALAVEASDGWEREFNRAQELDAALKIATEKIAELQADRARLAPPQHRAAFRAGYAAHPGDIGGWAFDLEGSAAGDLEPEAWDAWQRDNGVEAVPLAPPRQEERE